MNLRIPLLFFFFLISSFLRAQSGHAYYKKKLSVPNSEISDPYLGKAVKLLESQQYELTFNKDFASFKKMERMNTETSRIVEAYANSFSNFTGEYYYNYHEKIGVHKEEFSGESFLIQNQITFLLNFQFYYQLNFLILQF